MSMAESQSRSDAMPILVIMGATGCGKSTIGAALAERFSLPFMDADDYHPVANVEKMSQGIALEDADRWPWLDILSRAMVKKADAHGGVVCGCSALKRSYRDFLRSHIGKPVQFVLLDGHRSLLLARMNARKDHYMPPSLLDSQLATLERPDADEQAIIVSIDQDVPAIVAAIEAALG